MNSILKRTFDIVASALGLCILSPIMLLIALIVVLDSPGPALYFGRRLGRQGKAFRICKFRSMYTSTIHDGPCITVSGDPRVTRVGRWLRLLKLDELPQLWNVLIGQMSFVGPRPEDPKYVALYTAEQSQVLQVRPGITSLTSLIFRYEEKLLHGDAWESEYTSSIMPNKLAIDLAYLRQFSLKYDLLLIFATIFPIALDSPALRGIYTFTFRDGVDY
jgi:lipopolysaccharide/colanic/teichoic acid biosynthesis glycosyltransferase